MEDLPVDASTVTPTAAHVPGDPAPAPAQRPRLRLAAPPPPDDLLAELTDLESTTPVDAAAQAIRVRAVFERARSAGLDHEAGRAELLLADLDYRGEDVAAAAATARTVLAAADRTGDDLLAARAQHVLAWCLDRLGALGEAYAHAVEAVRLLPDGAPEHLRITHLGALAVMGGQQSGDDGWVATFEQVLASADAHGHPDLVMIVLNNFAWLHDHHGNPAAALPLVRRMQDLTDRRGTVLNSTELDTVAAVLLHCGDVAGAEVVARAALSPEVPDVEPRGRPEALLTLARVRHARGGPAGALELVARAEALAVERDLPEVVAAATDQRSALLAELGDFRGAYLALATCHETWKRVRDQRAEDRASALHAAFETDRVRRRSDAFEELAERDALTGLYNRRHLDRVLPGLLAADRTVRGPVSLAIVDVDHFKRINDTRSHQAGDTVLAGLGRLLAGRFGDTVVVARLGGEEFLLVMVGTREDAALAVCESVRRMVLGHDWSEATGDLLVTVSIGCTTVTGSATPSDALHLADRALYDAKHAGRNRVRAAAAPPPG